MVDHRDGEYDAVLRRGDNCLRLAEGVVGGRLFFRHVVKRGCAEQQRIAEDGRNRLIWCWRTRGVVGADWRQVQRLGDHRTARRRMNDGVVQLMRLARR